MNNQIQIQPLEGISSTTSRAVDWRFVHLDPPLLLGVIMLCCSGLLVLFSASDGDEFVVQRQGLAMLAGMAVMLVVAQLNMRLFRSWALALYMGGLGLLVLVLFIGIEGNGARSWLDLPGLPSFQPSELMKFAVPGLIASYLAARPLPPHFGNVLACLTVIAVPTAMIVMQNDVGTALMVAMSGIFVLLLAGVRWSLVSYGLLLLLLASPLWYLLWAQPHQKSRILTFFDPYRDPAGSGYNIIQSQIAIGSGGIYGKGYQQGAQSHLDFIPESNTDFILAVLAEEFGLVGVLMLIAMYLVVLTRGFYIALNAKDMFNRLLAGSITLVFFLYVFVNMAMVSGLLPVVGLPLPLISRGGTSAVTLFIGLGVLMSIQSHAARPVTAPPDQRIG